MAGGLNRIDPETGAVRTFRHDPSDESSIAADGIMSLMQDRSGTLWLGTFGGGVSRLDPGEEKFVNYRHDPENGRSLSSPRATSIVEDSNGIVWVGTDGGGLNRLDRSNGEWQHFVHDANDPASLTADTIYTLHADPAGIIWIGTRAGLNRLTDAGVSPAAARFGDTSARDGLTNNAIYSIESDQNGDLWLGTSRGLVRYSPRSGLVRSFHESQGLQGEEFNFGASFANKDGELFFGGSNGFNTFKPSNLEFNTEPPAVVLTTLAVLNQPVSSDRPYELIESISLDYSDDVVTFGISALDFSAPDENRYSYRLEGFDDDWVDAGNERRITYTNLDGGDYTLRVRAANGDGYWNDIGLSIPLSVANPPWKTWWAYSLYVLSLLALILALARHQQKKLQREAEYSRRLEQEVEQRTDELNRKNVDLEEVNDKLRESSTTDPLTGLRNRRFLFEQVSKDVDLVLRHYRDGTETMAPGGNNDLLFLMVDLDNFKPVNDSCGHEAGDELLCQIRDVLLEACRFSDDVIRWGGDEFLIVARDTNRKYAAILAERIRSSLSQRVFPVGNGQVARTTASIGYASFPFIKEQPELLDWEEVLGVADTAMYEAKKKRNAWLGIEGIDWNGTSEELYSAIKFNPGKLAEEGMIIALESVEDAEEKYG
jgi:diguanylate cyclase (GGDEF)-like protein